MTILSIQQPATAARDIFGGAPPHNIEAEQCLLGAILVYNRAFAYVEPNVAAEDFFEPIHRQIYEVCATLIGAGKLATPVTLKSHLPAGLDVGGLTLSQYLARLAAEATTLVNAPDYAKTVRELADRRRMIDAGEDFIAILKAAPVEVTPAEIAADTIERLDEIATGHAPHSLRAISIGEAARESRQRTLDGMARSGEISGMTWGLVDLDRRTDGIHRGDFVIVAARPGMCKTGLGLHVGLSAAKHGNRGLMWSGEMPALDLADRAKTAIVYQFSGGSHRIPYDDVRRGRNLSEADLNRLLDAEAELDRLPFVIEQQPGLTIAQIAMRARRRKQKEGLDLLILDHLDIVSAADRYRGDRTAEVSELSHACKALAKELNIGVLALCQLNRKTEDYENKRAQLSNLRQSGSLEQDADVVLFPYREAYYLMQREPEPSTVEHLKWEEALAACISRLEINVAKQRQGATGIVNCFTAIECNAFYDATPAERGGDRQPGLAA